MPSRSAIVKLSYNQSSDAITANKKLAPAVRQLQLNTRGSIYKDFEMSMDGASQQNALYQVPYLSHPMLY